VYLPDVFFVKIPHPTASAADELPAACAASELFLPVALGVTESIMIIGPGMTLVGSELNTTLLAYALHTSVPPRCEALAITAHALLLPVLYVHVKEFSHDKHTVFNVMRTLTSTVMAGELSQWVQPSFLMYLDCYDNIVVQSPEHILELMAEFDTDLLIAGEEHCWPDPTQVFALLEHHLG
jgi:hypothetical protein